MHQLSDLYSLANDGFAVLRLKQGLFDIPELARLYESVHAVHEKTVPLEVSPGYGGWSLLSGTGDFRDGWQPAGLAYDAHGLSFGTIEEQQPTTLTPICESPAARRALQAFIALGLSPLRTRIAEVTEDGGLHWHVDPEPITGKRWRAHLAIITNETAIFEWRIPNPGNKGAYIEHGMHIPADGHLYLIRTDLEHRVRQTGTRVHIISDFIVIHEKTEIEPCFKI